jgi:peroxiredoxin
MAVTPSTMVKLGTQAPPFSLPDTEGKAVTLEGLRGSPALLVMFLCNHCPYVKHVRTELASLTREYAARGVAMVGICSNDAVKYPADSPEKMREEKRAAGYLFSYLFDESQQVARAYDAACTPDFFVYDASQRLVYRGQMDDSRPGSGEPVSGRDLRAALDAVLAGEPVTSDQKPSMGCNIKWK